MNGKKWTMILIPLGVFLLGQLLWAVWWASSADTKLDILGTNQTAIIMGTKDRYTGKDALYDREQQKKTDQRQDDRINKLHTKGSD